MVVRVAERAARAGAERVCVATDHPSILQAVQIAGFDAVMTSEHHSSGTERLAEAADQLGLGDDAVVVNVQGDEPLIEPALISQVATLLQQDNNLQMATACHALSTAAEMFNPNVVKVVLDHAGRALYFSRAPIPYARDAFAQTREVLPDKLPVYRHIGLYGYRAGFLRIYRDLSPCALENYEALEQLRVLWHGYQIGVAIAPQAPAAGVDTAEDLERVRQLWAQTDPQ